MFASTKASSLRVLVAGFGSFLRARHALGKHLARLARLGIELEPGYEGRGA